MRPIIAIVGRPNVGKSTLFNRLVGHRRSLVRDVPGVTRDRLYGTVAYERWQAAVVDTGGFEPQPTSDLVAGVKNQVLIAIDEADLIIFVVDGRAGITPLDEEIAAVLRRSDRPVILAVNKVDTIGQDQLLGDAYRLGFSPVVPISAEHGRGVAELLEAARDRAPAPDAPAPGPGTRVAIIGRPNVGKSSLVNAVLGHARVLVHAEPGTTRDTVDTPVTFRDRSYVLIDTAGIRRKGRVSEALEKLSVVMALKSLERTDVAVLVLDASEGVTAQDAHIAGYADAAGRALIVAVNKWDLVPRGLVQKADVVGQIYERLPFLEYAPVCFTSATSRQGLPELFDQVDLVAAEAKKRIEPGALLNTLRQAIERRPMSARGVALRIYSIQQVGVSPPTFAVRVNLPDEIHFSYQRYLLNSLRHAFGFTGSPIRLLFRKGGGKLRARRAPTSSGKGR
jgi:GTP-binding protein